MKPEDLGIASFEEPFLVYNDGVEDRGQHVKARESCALKLDFLRADGLRFLLDCGHNADLFNTTTFIIRLSCNQCGGLQIWTRA